MQRVEWAGLGHWLAGEGDAVLLAASDIQAAEFRRQQLASVAGWERIQCLPVDQWLVACWDKRMPDRQVLRPLQLQAMAAAVLEEHPQQEQDVLHRDALLRQFLTAFEQAEQYDWPPEAGIGLSVDQQAFTVWRAALQQALDKAACLALSQLPAAMMSCLDDIEWPSRLLLLPGVELTPTQQALIEEVASVGVAVHRCELPQPVAQCGGALRFADPHAEVRAIADWIANRGSRRLALVSPDPSYWALLERELWQRYEGDAPVWRGTHMRLGDLPEIVCAWDLSALLGDGLEWEQLSRVLRSAAFGRGDELFYRRCELDVIGRERLYSGLSFKALRRFAERYVPDLEQWFEQLAAQRPESRRLLPSDWVRHLEALLTVCEWPRAGLADTAHRGVLKGLNESLDVLRSMDRYTGKLKLSEFRQWWWRLLSGKRFTPVCEDSNPVLMLSPEQCAGLRFDDIWVAGLNESCWPPMPRTLAMLDVARQRQLNMPQSSPAGCLREARLQQSQWRSACSVIRYSCALVGDDGVERLPSSLIEEPWQSPPAAMCSAALPLMQREADTVPAVSAAEVERWGGGTGLFKAYALSPFVGFCRHRLALKELALPLEGLDAATQGQCLHDALELIWSELGESAALQRLSEDALSALIRRWVSEALSRQAPAGRFGAVLIRLEQLRLEQLLASWFEWERSRSEPFEVIALEQAQQLRVGGIAIKARLDRVDRIGDRKLVMDYKSGKVVASKLNAGNLLEPQLPLYAVFGEGESCSGLALAQIHAQGISVHVRSEWTKLLAPGSRATHAVGDTEAWQQEKAAWAKRLQAIAAAILSGDIRHDPAAATDELRFYTALEPLWRSAEGPSAAEESVA